MTIRRRLILILIAMGLLPTLIPLFIVVPQMRRLVDVNQDALEAITVATIRDKAVATADQIEQYLANHPEIDPSDAAALMANQDLAVLAVQPVIGEDSYTAVFDDQAVAYFHPDPKLVGIDLAGLSNVYPEFWSIVTSSLGGLPAEGSYDWLDSAGAIRRKYMAIEPVEGTPLRVASTAYYDEFTQPAQNLVSTVGQIISTTQLRFSLLAVGMALAAVVVAIAIGTRVANPLRDLAEAADRVVQGEWDVMRPSGRVDEIGALDQALYALTGQMRDLVQAMEQEVDARAQEAARRTRYLEASAEVAHATTGAMDLSMLFSELVTSISRRFGYYHVGVFLLNSTREWAVLESASSEAGQKLLSDGYRVRVGEGDDAVGYATGWGTSRMVLAQRSGSGILFLPRLSRASYQEPESEAEGGIILPNPDLPDTRVELALPLRARGEIIGALDIHSTEEEAFPEEDVTVLQALADQVAVAISNARLFRRAQESLEAEQRAYGRVSGEAWQEMLRARSDLGFVRDEYGVSQADGSWGEHMKAALRTGRVAFGDGEAASAAAPIKVRDRVIGVVDAHRPAGGGAWTPDQITLLETLAGQLGQALESARLHRDTRRRAARERVVGEVAARVRETLDMETMLRTAVQEMRQALGLPEVVIQLAGRPGGGGENGAE